MTTENIPIIGIDLELICETTGWRNNCGLNCLAHFIYSKLESGELEDTFGDFEPYLELLETFKEYYELKKTPTWEDIKKLLIKKKYNTPIMHEVILAPVLRKYLGKVLFKFKDKLWQEANAGISEYLSTGKVNDIATPIYYSNRDFLEDLKLLYDTDLAQALSSITPEQRNAAIIKLIQSSINDAKTIEKIGDTRIQEIQAQLAEIKEHGDKQDILAQFCKELGITEEKIWNQIRFDVGNKIQDELMPKVEKNWFKKEGGAWKYSNYMGDIDNSEMVSVGQFTLLCQELFIGLEVYTPASIEKSIKEYSEKGTYPKNRGAQDLLEGEYLWTMKVLNEGGAHWEYEEPEKSDQKCEKHNEYYPRYNLKNPETYKKQMKSEINKIQEKELSITQEPQPLKPPKRKIRTIKKAEKKARKKTESPTSAPVKKAPPEPIKDEKIHEEVQKASPPPRPSSQAPEKPEITSRQKPVLLSSQVQEEALASTSKLTSEQKKLYRQSQIALNKLLDAFALLDPLEKDENIKKDRKATFELYFEAFAKEFKKGSAMDTNEVLQLLKGIKDATSDVKEKVTVDESKKKPLLKK